MHWTWSTAQEEAFNKAKQLITTAPILAFYDPQKELYLENDASEYRLDAVLFQDERPIAYASRMLTDAQTRYAQVEKEMLAISFGLTRFHHYTYGRDVHVITDHKPLESIVKKPLSRAPKRLQNLLLKVQYYTYDLQYRDGKSIPVADALSRAPLQGEPRGETVKSVFHSPMSKD